MYLGRNVTYECLQNNCINNGVLKRKYLMENNVSFKNDTLNVTLLQMKG